MEKSNIEKFNYLLKSDHTVNCVLTDTDADENVVVPETYNDKKVSSFTLIITENFNIKSITLNSNIKSFKLSNNIIPDQLFPSLQSITIPEDINSIPNQLFTSKFPNLKTFEISSENETYKIINNSLVNIKTKTLINYLSDNITLPKSDLINNISEFAFDKILKSYSRNPINIPNNIHSIPNKILKFYNFGSCDPDNPYFYIEKDCLIYHRPKKENHEKIAYCNILLKYFGKSSTPNFSKLKLNIISKNAFINNDYITELEIPYSIKLISNKSINNCKNLTSVILPKRPIKMSENNFYYNCKNLQKENIQTKN